MAVALLVLSCGEDDVGQLSAAAEPHARAFAAFERWVQRAQDGATALTGPNLVREATFSPIRNRQNVLAAQVSLAPERILPMTMPGEASFPENLPWVTVRHAQHGALQVVEQTNCDLGLPGWWRRGVSRACVMISRTTSVGVDDQLTVTMAFSRSAP